jgi:Flp pilus assembly pilin Flp
MTYGKLWACLASVVAEREEEGGQALGEYALLLTLIAMGAVVALTALGLAIPGFWEPVTNVFP